MEIVIQAEKDILSGDVRAMGKDGLERLFSLFSQMEYMGSLGERFSLTEDIRDKMLSEEKAFSENYAAYQHELENILVYFLYRYFIKSTRDYAAEERLFTAVYMTLAARGLFLREYAEKGVLPDLDRRILLVKELSKEVEYDSDNMDIIYDEIQQSADTRDMLCGLCFQGDI
jgi:lysine-N-methylase